MSAVMIATVSGGQVSGDRLKGTVVGASGDWVLVGADGYGRTDVRVTVRTVDGAIVYIQYCGLLEMTPAVQDSMSSRDR